MKPRYYPRALVKASVIFTHNGFMSDGQVLNATVPGCCIQSKCPATKGDSLRLRVMFPQTGDTFLVVQAVVRWVTGSRFGVEFIEMDPTEQVLYKALIDALLQFEAPKHGQPARKQFSQHSGGVNWHLVADAA
jgi:hypothetical protein